MKLTTIAIIPAPTGSFIVEGPYNSDSDSVYISPCAFLALVTDRYGESHVVPVGFGDEMDAELTDGTAALYPSIDAAEAEMAIRIATIKKQKP